MACVEIFYAIFFMYVVILWMLIIRIIAEIYRIIFMNMHIAHEHKQY